MDATRLSYLGRLSAVVIFAVAMAYVEAAVVVYLRELYYPEGFALPLKELPEHVTGIEIVREAATLIMLGAVAWIAGKFAWERFGWFIVAFGTWDIFYYVWLKVTLDWPSSLAEWDILFLIPVPWLGPVIAPVLVAIFMVVFGALIALRFSVGKTFTATPVAWAAALVGSGLILYSFMYDTRATLSGSLPQTYPYWLLISGLLCYLSGFVHAWQVSDRLLPDAR